VSRISATERRGDFVKAAIEVIAAHGIDGATTRRITDEANANLAMLHYCYGTKEDLFADVFKYVSEKFQELAPVSEPQASVEQTARRLLRGAMECYLESPSFAAAAMELINWARRQHGDSGIAVYDQAMEMMRAALRDSASGQALDSETIDEIVYTIATLADGFAVNWITYNDPSVVPRQMEIADSVLGGWLRVRLGSAAIAG
jgi:AcrR family transcriptional regulator